MSCASFLVLLGVLLGRPFEGLFAVPIAGSVARWLKPTLTFALLVTALMTAVEIVKHVVVISRRKMSAAR
jgi:hypothetical protein